MAEIETEHLIHVEQEPLPYYRGVRANKQKDTLRILFNVSDLRGPRRNFNQEYRSLTVSLSDFKHQLSPSNPHTNPAAKSKQLISSCLASLTVPVPEWRHADVIRKVLEAAEEAEEAEELRVAVNVIVISPGFLSLLRQGPVDGGGGGGFGGGVRTPAAKSAINNLKSIVVTDQVNITVDAYADEQTCAVCIEDLNVSAITELPCRHRFHVHCISQCLEISHLCPLCRYVMPTEEE